MLMEPFAERMPVLPYFNVKPASIKRFGLSVAIYVEKGITSRRLG